MSKSPRIASRTPSVKLRNTLLSFYGEFGDVEAAQSVFAEEETDTVALNNMMGALIENGRSKEALALYDGHSANKDDVSHLFAIQACDALRELERGQPIYALSQIEMPASRCTIR